MPRPQEHEFASYYARYISYVKEDDVLMAFASQAEIITPFLQSIPDDKWDYAYAEGKWTVKELVQHVIDTERIFSYRALRIARKDETPLPGFDENTYAPASLANRRNATELIEEFLAVRKSTELLFKSFTSSMLQQKGIASNQSITVNALGFITLGHFYHHKTVLEERYL
ncbi:MAG TPA: DinB family protein [Chitinophagaceae bacterium]|nr:DinB family protein [Chitinophagaceae bacterium]